MLRRRLAVGLIAFAISTPALIAPVRSVGAQDWARIAPYTDIIWPSDTTLEPRIQLDGREWFTLLSIDSVPVASILAFARARYAGQWRLRFNEDLYDVLVAMNRPARDTVLLGMRDSLTGRTVERLVRMTSEDRGAVYAATRARAGGVPRLLPGVPPRPATLSPADVTRDLAFLQKEMEERWAYLKANNANYLPALAALRAKGANGMSHTEFGVEVKRIIAMFIDGHASVGGFTYPPGSLPFHLESSDGRLLAVRHDRASFVDSTRPYVTHIDGRPVADWLNAAAPFVSKASPQWMLRNETQLVQRIQFIRTVMQLPMRDSVTVELVARDAGNPRTITLSLAPTGRPAPAPPRGESRMLDGNIGYLRLAAMNAAAVAEVAAWMPRFRNTRGLIIDVRGNGGGSRDALRALFPYVMSEGDAPRVINAAKYRLHPEYRDDHLGGSRYMYRENSPEWTAAERAAIAQFKATFRPEWEPPAAEFSDWHYIVMSRRTNPAAFVYGKPVVVLLDERSFSATDIFVAAFKGWRDVTLIGTPSGGGSARQVPVTLPVSRLSFTLASMASFQLNGRLFDGNGTQPDILVHPEPGYFLVDGRDNVLDRAIQHLTRQE